MRVVSNKHNVLSQGKCSIRVLPSTSTFNNSCVAHHILITGASGLIGKELTSLLLQQGHEVTHLGRSKREGQVASFTWDVDKQQIDERAFEGVDTIIHLAGAGIADKRWTPSRKQEILESRTLSTRLLYQELQRGKHEVKTVISASAIGYYGFDGSTHIFTEDSKPGTDFLAQVTQQWEQEVDAIATLGIRVVKIRIGIVLSTSGGALKEMMQPIKLYVGSPLGKGNQLMSWIHMDDLAALFVAAVEDGSLRGAYNGVAPHPVTNKQFTTLVAQYLKKPLWLPAVPEFVMRIILGEMADLVLRGSNVSSKKVERAGFSFQYETLERALENLLRR